MKRTRKLRPIYPSRKVILFLSFQNTPAANENSNLCWKVCKFLLTIVMGCWKFSFRVLNVYTGSSVESIRFTVLKTFIQQLNPSGLLQSKEKY